MSTDAALLGARSARLYHLYARAVDDGDIEGLRALVTDDIQITLRGAPSEAGIETFLDVYRAHNALRIPVGRHVISNVLAHQDGGDSGDIVTWAYFEATLLRDSGTEILYGVYEDVLREVDGELRIAHKKIAVHRRLELPAAMDTFTHAVARE